ncbi:solute carrier family 39 (zinc transporter), member 1/2/3 [Kwoniella mangroviensis CBS 10435]|uniref:Solute carrier family 39 (Zinc transporter), member 1/2/3 n=1 Tax=Kwoniella mangroviensis CBS 10435 TaxID=1331196 RepID=A0A1B9IU27_9TREE|nr:solute carrier family 39 (zinc transporter), member 1/2/3 [Kwoniella mangroviensis CBS 10435]
MSDTDSGAVPDVDSEDPCAISNDDSRRGLRIGAIFIILVTSLLGTLTPIVFRQSERIPTPVFDFAKYFGSGVIIATAFIHLLAPAWDELTSECLSGAWTDYDWAPAIAMAAVYGIFFAEVAAYRIGTKRLEKLGVHYSSHAQDNTDAHSHTHARDPPLSVDTSADAPPHHIHPSASNIRANEDIDPQLQSASEKQYRKADLESSSDIDTVNQLPSSAEAAAQLVAVAVLEFGVVLHSVIIGLTLGVTDDFITLFIVIIFHQMFEGLGLGSRLASLNLPKNLGYTRWVAAALYSICTPIGIAIGVGARNSYNGNGATANIVSGVLDATSAGILLYTGLVELMAHEILLNPRMMKSRDLKLAYIFVCMLLGSGLMALLGRWA